MTIPSLEILTRFSFTRKSLLPLHVILSKRKIHLWWANLTWSLSRKSNGKIIKDILKTKINLEMRTKSRRLAPKKASPKRTLADSAQSWKNEQRSLSIPPCWSSAATPWRSCDWEALWFKRLNRTYFLKTCTHDRLVSLVWRATSSIPRMIIKCKCIQPTAESSLLTSSKMDLALMYLSSLPSMNIQKACGAALTSQILSASKRWYYL